MDKWFGENIGTITEKKIYDILKDCKNGLHYHIKAEEGTYGTCWSYIISPEDNDVLISTGPPCKNPFKPPTWSP